MQRRQLYFGLGFLLASVVTSAPALAQQPSSPPSSVANDYPACTKPVSPADSDRARDKFVAARQDYEEGNYDSALRRFRDAYAIDCSKPELLLVVSAAYERKGDKKEALAALETYIQRAPPNAPEISTTNAKIENLKKELAKATPPPPPPTQPQPQPDVQEHTLYPWIVVGAGVAALGVGIVLLATAPELPTTCDSSTGMCDPINDKATPPRTKAIVDKETEQAGTHRGQVLGGTITTIGGGVLIVGGVVWHFIEPTGPKTRGFVRPTPLVAPGLAGLSLGGSF